MHKMPRKQWEEIKNKTFVIVCFSVTTGERVITLRGCSAVRVVDEMINRTMTRNLVFLEDEFIDSFQDAAQHIDYYLRLRELNGWQSCVG